MSSLRFVNPRVVQARLCVKVMKMKSKWSEGNSKIFIPSVFTEKKGGGKKSKKSEWQRKQERRNEIEYWRSVEIRESTWIASDHRSQGSCPELSYPGFLSTHTCNIHRDIFAFRHREGMRYLPGEILRCRNSSISRPFFFFFFRNRSCRIESRRWNIFIPEESYFESRTSDKRRRSIVKYFKVSTRDFLNCSPSWIYSDEYRSRRILMNFVVCAVSKQFEDIWRMWRCA